MDRMSLETKTAFEKHGTEILIYRKLIYLNVEGSRNIHFLLVKFRECFYPRRPTKYIKMLLQSLCDFTKHCSHKVD
jgi:hypothetical protein